MSSDDAATYASAGVDIAAGDEAVERIKGVVASTVTAGVLSSIGGFGGLFELDLERFASPVLVASTDGVGTKLEIARLTGRYDTVGIDLVAMCVDDLVCVGATPLFLLDYVAVGAVDPEHIATVVGGVATGCRLARCALLGGETAEHGGVMGAGDLDLAGFAVGVVSKGTELGPDRVRAGDVLVGISSPGLRSNGYTLARHVLLERSRLDLDGPAYLGATTSLGEELLRPSVIYAPAILDVMERVPGAVHAVAHITGGGLAANLTRALPEGLRGIVDRSGLPIPEIFGEIQTRGHVADDEMRTVFNLGVGMVLVVDRQHAPEVVSSLIMSGVGPAAVIGEIEQGEREVIEL